ncbi:heterodisulfide reductase subunit B [Desulfocicer vacuolatum DSM 3385]|uniref:Heterodisulfide reductase subunit B n=1 Tax=Desulfocicer vacuolatum DSM 3385 TaxID=1121400 RepID=A0A1W2AJJ2_9BACT|nr:CoB--CoM heterodisulfide reductase iron-sulfur subunit B family protein [Desulfocicer vacuolatum]SMC60730.1 heterodisulfide reductase subunit B [Desulfocicer vacuolatum DSM 3385]
MKYIYYPGCSLEESAIEYDGATRALMAELGEELIDIEDWNCCGATAAEPMSELLSFVLPARNIALAEKIKNAGDILVPCSACYLNLKKVMVERDKDENLSHNIDEALAVDDLKIKGTRRVRHLLDVLAHDIGAARIAQGVMNPLKGLKIAPYYGCQCLRPYGGFDDPEEPVTMTGLIEACGADVFPWDSSAVCCGASGMNTKREVSGKLVQKILMDARGADAIVTVCPMCQMNLEGFQKSVARGTSEDLSITVLYLPQLLGLAMGLSEEAVMLHKNLAVADTFLEVL